MLKLLPSLKLTVRTAPKNGWLEDDFLSCWDGATWQVRTVSFKEGVSKNNGGFPPKSSHLLIGFSIIFTIHFGVPLCLETPRRVVVCSTSTKKACFDDPPKTWSLFTDNTEETWTRGSQWSSMRWCESYPQRINMHHAQISMYGQFTYIWIV